MLGGNLPNAVSKHPVYGFSVRLVPMLVVFALLVVAVVWGYRINNTPIPAASATLTAAQTPAKQPAPPPAPAPAVDPLAALPTDINTVIAGQSQLSASATCIDLATGKEYDAGNSTQTYEAASTSKLVAVFDYIHQVELGKATLTQSIQGQSAQDIIMRMIVYSDNDAWDKLNKHLGFKGEQAYLDSIGVAGRMVPSNIQFSTPAMAKMLRLMYQGQLMNADHRAMVLNYMSHTTSKNLISAAFPADATVYHKYGQIEGVLHDAAIVEYQGHTFILVVYTNNPAGTAGLYSAQVNLIHGVATAVLNDVIKS